MSTTNTGVTSLTPSELGTKEYWDNVYAREITNHTNDNDDEGTVWFDENSAEDTVIRLLDSLAEQQLLHKSGARASRILDLGTGNGHMLFALRSLEEEDDENEAWQGEMIGVDYSLASIDLAKRIGEQRGIQPAVRFEAWDLLKQSPSRWLEDGFDLVLDKGTFDAISLMAQQPQEPHSCDVYFNQVAGLVKPGGLLVITSCNWTKAELLSWLSRSTNSSLKYFDQATYPSFTFGGQTGQSIVSIVFRRYDQ